MSHLIDILSQNARNYKNRKKERKKKKKKVTKKKKERKKKDHKLFLLQPLAVCVRVAV